jgi:hypothetical protein
VVAGITVNVAYWTKSGVESRSFYTWAVFLQLHEFIFKTRGVGLHEMEWKDLACGVDRIAGDGLRSG